MLFGSKRAHDAGNGLREKGGADKGVCRCDLSVFPVMTKVQDAKETRQELPTALVAAKAARTKCAEARLALRAHKVEHGC